MKYENDKVTDVQIAYIGGGSRGWAWTFMTDLALDSSLNGTIRLYDIDRKAAEQNEKIGNILTDRKEVKGKWNYETKSSLEEALDGCDFVVISILPGTFEQMESDVHLPERLGIWQPVGDSTGPGGIIRGLRTIPMYVEIAKAIEKYSPDAWVINYTNPMSLCVKTLYSVFPEIKAFGCCHEVFGTQMLLKRVCEMSCGLENIDRHDIIVNVLGINHFTWFDQASYKGIDLFPLYQDFVNEHYDTGFDESDNNWLNHYFTCSHRVKFDLFRRYGLIAAAGDRHLAEFMPGTMYLNNPEDVNSWKFSLTPVSFRKEQQKEKMEKSERLVNGSEQMELTQSGEEGIQLIKALCGLTRVISNVNIPNSCLQIENLPSDAVVETNAVFSKDSISPIHAGLLPHSILDLTRPIVENHERVLKAALNRDRSLVYEAFMNDPLLKGRADKRSIEQLADDMIHNTIEHF